MVGWKLFILVLLGVAIVASAAVYWFCPRTVVGPTIVDTLYVNLPPVPPDNTYRIKYKFAAKQLESLQKYCDDLLLEKNDLDSSLAWIYREMLADTTAMIDIAEKTFSQSFLVKKDTVATAKVKMQASALGPIFELGGDATIVINNKWMQNNIDNATKEARKQGIQKGGIIGTIGGIVLATTITLLVK
jgi:uncharacterized protein